MESNGKGVAKNGIRYPTGGPMPKLCPTDNGLRYAPRVDAGPIVFGEPGTTG